MAWDDTQTGSDEISAAEWNNMVTYTKSVIATSGTLASSTTFPTTIVDLTTSQTLTNKTITAGGTFDANGQDLQNIMLAEFSAEYDNGNSSTADTIDWNNGNMQKSTLTGNVTYTFTAPSGPSRVQLRILTGAGSFTAAWPATVKWASGTAPTITATASAVDIVTFYYDGTDYYGDIVQDMS